MPAGLTADDRAALESVVSQLEATWNAMDGPAFAAPFAGDADFVTIRGRALSRTACDRRRPCGHLPHHLGGKHEPVHHRRIRLLRPEVALVHVHSLPDAPRGPFAGKHRARFSLVLTKVAGRWEIAALHNTLEAVQRPPR